LVPPEMIRFKKGNSVWLLAIIAVGAFLRFHNLGSAQLWLDELLRLVRFSHPTLWECLLDLRQDVAAVPLDYMIQQAVLNLLGFSEFAARLHAALFGCLAVAALYTLGKEILQEKAALCASLLMAVYPLHVYYSQEGANYSLFCLLTIGSYGLFIKSIQEEKPIWWICFTFVTIANLYTNYLAGTVLIAQGIFLTFLRLQSLRLSAQRAGAAVTPGKIGPFLGSGAAAVIVFLPWFVWTVGSAQRDLASPFAEATLILRIFKEVSGGSYPLSLVLFLLFGSGIVALVRRREWKTVLLLTSWLVIPILLVLLLDAWRGYFFAIRQVLFATPALLLGAAEGIATLPQVLHGARTGKALQQLSLLLIIVLGIGTLLIGTKKDQADWKGLNRHLEKQVARDDLITAPHIERVVNYGFPLMMQRSVALESIEAEFSSLGARRVHLIESRYQTPEQKAEISRILAIVPPSQSIELNGFRIHLLDPKR